MSRFTFSEPEQDDSNGCFPDGLKEYDQWLVTVEKAPRYPEKGWNDSVNLLSFTEAQREAEGLGGEVAFCFTESGPFVGFDLDDVKEGSDFTDEALTLVERLDSYTEVSSSGTGLHIIAEGEHLDNRKTRGDLSEAGHLEVYDESRYFVLTGDVFNGLEAVESRSTAVRVVQEEHLPKTTSDGSAGKQKPLSEQEYASESPDVTPKQVRRTIEAYVNSNKHDVDEAVLRLWRGSDEGYESTSEADMGFVKQLYFWCQGDPRLMDECFRASSRMRRKWDEVRTSDGATYGELTIREVCRSNTETFGGKYVG